ncbi:beta strand repeat-containing protein [Bdellovibrio sp. HCB337]|uniref:beta strand repeat-containing protein n=1 Tax=Bdellovibrio sp. HCB337 TaxID=3394358 RepID=UPI0039A564C6
MLRIKTPQSLALYCLALLMTTACSDANLAFNAEPVTCEAPSSSVKNGASGPVILYPTIESVVRNTVKVTGSCVSGVQVEIKEASGNITKVDCVNGMFSLDMQLSDGDGQKDLMVQQNTATDGGLVVDRLCFMKDTVPPNVTITNGNSSQSSNTTSTQVTGRCESGLQVIISGPGLVNPVTTDCNNGTFTATVQTNPGDGTKNIVGTQVDRAGNQGAASSTVNVDMSAPNVRITSTIPAVTNQSSLTVSGVCETGLPVEIGQLRATTAPAAACINGTFTTSIPLPGPDGAVTARVFQVDNAGNIGFDSRNLLKDTVAPNVTITSPLANVYLTPTSTFTGACETGINVQLSGTVLSAATSVACTSSQWTLTTAISAGQGAKTLIATQTDAAGNVGQRQQSYMVDTIAPAIAITSPAANSYIGTSFQLVGTCETGLTVQIAGAGVLPPTSTSCTNGAFSATVSASSLDGQKLVTASQTDAAGNTGSTSRTFLRDSLGPLLTITSPANGTYVGASMTLTGTCEAGLTITFTGDVASSSSIVCAAGGTFSAGLTLSAGDGAKNITAREVDSAGNASTVTGNFLKDTTAPVVAITSPAANTTGQTGLTVGGTCETGLGVRLTGTGVASTVNTTCSNGTFSAAITFSAGSGSKQVIASQTDLAGNTGSDTETFISDSTAPAVTITSPAANTYVAATFTIQGACETGLQVTLNGAGLASAVTAACTSGAYSANVTVSAGDGTKAVTATQTDSANNVATASRNFLRDTTAPVLTITSPANGTTAQNGITLVGTCEAGLTVSISGAGVSAPSSVTCAANGTYSANLSFSNGDGAKTVLVSETDAAGNNSQVTGTFNRDATPPAIAITSPAADTPAQNGLTIGGACEAGLNVSLTGGGLSAPMTVACSASGTFTADITFSNGSGTKTVTASQTDAVGNSASSSRNFVRDLIAPVVTITAPAANSYLAANFTVQGACETGLQVTVGGAGVATATSVPCNAGAYSATVAVSSGEGVKVVTASQTDAVGNVGTATRSFQRDTVAPALAITSPANGSSVPVSATLTGTCEAGLAVVITGNITSTSASCPSGNFSTTITFSAGLGAKNVQVQQTDAAGNVGTATAQYMRDSNGNSETFISDASFGKIDILFIDDNSASMDPKQTSLASKFNGFASELMNIDWQIGITTTDCSTGPFGICGSLLNLTGYSSKILTPSVPNYQTVFSNSIQRPETAGCLDRGDCPAGASEPLLSATTAMNKRNTDNNGFFRANSDLAIVILSDADERQTGGATYANRPNELVQAFSTNWPSGKKLKVYSIIVQPGDATCLDTMRAGSNGFSFYGDLVNQTVNLTSGLSTSICAPDYTVTLKSIGESVRTLTNSVALAHTPIAGSVTVTFTPNQSITYKVIGNKVVFDSPPSVGTEIKVDYQY